MRNRAPGQNSTGIFSQPDWPRLILLTALLAGPILFSCYSSGPLRPAPDSVAARATKPVPTISPTRPPADDASPSSPPLATPVRRPSSPGFETPLISHGDRASPYIALTFDAGENAAQPAGFDETIIRILTGTGTPATLFLGGLWMQRHPHQAEALAANPLFELGNHAWSHPDFTQLSPEAMAIEIQQTQAVMRQLTGRQATLFRFPFGAYNAEALQVVSEQGLLAIQWDVLTGDPDPGISAKDIVQTVTAQAQNGSIVIMHLNGRGQHTAEALLAIINRLRDRGYTFVTISQLLAPATSEAPSQNKGLR